MVKWKNLFISQYNHNYNKAEIHKSSYQCLFLLKAVVSPEKYATEFIYLDEHPSKFDYNDGDTLEIRHLISLLIYCNYDV